MIKRDALVKTRHSGLDPQLIEADTFKIIILTGYKAAGQALDDENMEKLLSFCRTPRTTKEIMQFIADISHVLNISFPIFTPGRLFNTAATTGRWMT